MARRQWGVSRSLSSRLVRADTYPVGSEIWTNDDGEVWVLAEVVSQENTILTARQQSTGDVLEIDLGFGEAHPQNPKVVSDMTALHYIHEAGILHNLRERSKLSNQRPYSFMGTILIAVNPLRRVPDPEMSEYVNRPLNSDSPHPYAIAELAYHQMLLGAGRDAANQSIVVSGESGAGKTETSKIILRFLAHRSVEGVTDLDQKVVESSPILESFGNAKTLRNNNSSRFAKFLKLQFTGGEYRLAGAFVETYLLENSRVLKQGTGERNFHILYQLIAGASGVGEDLKVISMISLKLGSINSYKILSQSNCTALDGVDDAEEFRRVQAALDTIGVDEESQMQVWKMLASVLHMSNLEFDKVDHEQGDIASISNRQTLSALATFLAAEESALEAMLTQTVTVARGETFTKQLSPDAASLTRDAIVKSLYEALFLWVVSAINTSLGKGEDSLPFIGVLDIFGFENLDTKNEFEQLLINFSSESLQETFNKQVFNNELRLYEDEGIGVVVSHCPDNSDCLKLLSAKPNGILPSLDNVCAEPRPSDARYLDGLHKTYAQHQDFPRTNQKDVRENFSVKHYAGKVKYTVHGWVARNMDRIPESFSSTLATSMHKVVREAASKYGKAPAGAEGKGKATRTRKALLKPTVAEAFLSSQRDLNATLLSTTCTFARCIKPNTAMQCGIFDNRYVVGQLRCLGILQTCEVLKVGMPTRVSYAELKEVLGDTTAEAEKLFAGEPETALVAAILWAFEVPSEVFRLGKTRVFFRAGQISTLQKILNETGPEKGPWVFGRLQDALASRHKAKAAAEQAQAAVKSAEGVVREAGEATANATANEGEEGDEDGSARPRRAAPNQAIASSCDDEYRLESAVKRARKVAVSCALQVAQFLQAAKQDAVGTYAVGAFERVTTASEEAQKTISAASSIADELDEVTRKAIGGDVAGDIRRLEDALVQLREHFQETKKLATAAEDAAAKCQVEKTKELMGQTVQQASAVVAGAEAHRAAAKEVARASERRAGALQEANGLLPSVNVAVDEALGAASSFQKLVEEVSAEEVSAKENAAKEASDATANADAEARRRAAAKKAYPDAEETAAPELEDLSLDTNETEDDVANLESKAPKPESRGQLLVKQAASRSVRDLVDTVAPLDTSVSPGPEVEVGDIDNLNDLSAEKPMRGISAYAWPASQGDVDQAMEIECVEGYLLEHDVLADRWASGYFRLEDGLLACFDKKSLVGTNPHKAMKLTAHSMASNTNMGNCFCVCTGEVVWFLAAEDLASKDKWMTAINADAHDLFINKFNVPEDNYWSQGVDVRSVYRMLDSAPAQWILTYPEEAAPRTGEGLFPGDVVEVVQEFTNKENVFFRLADDRGWTHSRSSVDNAILLEEVNGEFTVDTKNYWYPLNVSKPVSILLGPGLDSSPEFQSSGDTLLPGRHFEAAERFTPAKGPLAFIRLADGRGWVAVKKGEETFGQ